MNKEALFSIPLPTIRRFPAYLRLLKDFENAGESWVSATRLAEDLRLKPIQVRKDMSCTGVEGKPKVGFEVHELIMAIEHHLGWDNATDAILIGAGNLGNALVGYKGFANYGLRIVAILDNDKKKIGTTVYGVTVQSMEHLEETVVRLGVNIAVLTVPAEVAQEVAEMVVAAGIKGIWNFVPKNLTLPEDIIVQRTDLATSFAELSSRIKKSIEEKSRTKRSLQN
ncbi:MAG: redox-sensing transcriptional repressor Rex [Spirochaetia bacterium]|nr:redox-sensing transcriptional repressor Rex [Spirochaetia bacterium]MCF7941232.1 redox-sensing transcriptional repressor Rex [Spirochaetia bacterium]